MSIQAVGWVLDNSETRLSARLVLLAIANHADKQNGLAWPSLTTLAREARLSRSQVIRAVHGLVRDGHLSVQESGSPHGTNLYSILWMVAGETAAEKGGSRKKRPAQKRPALVANPPNAPSKMTPEPSLEKPSVEPLGTNQGKPTTLISLYHDLFQAKFGQPPVIHGGKDGTLLKRLERPYGADKVAELLKAFFFSDDPWITASGYTVGAFHASVNKLLAREAQRDGPKAQARRIGEMVGTLAEAKRLR